MQQFSQFPQPHLFLMLGVPGAGKTTVAKLLSQALGAEHVWADSERHQRIGSPPYTVAQNLEFYAELNTRVAKLLKNGHIVIYDAAFNYTRDRHALRTLAQMHGSDTTIVWIQTPEEVAAKRAITPGASNRILGAMSPARFAKLSHKLEEPESSEVVVKLDGTHITKAIINDLIAQIIQR